VEPKLKEIINKINKSSDLEGVLGEVEALALTVFGAEGFIVYKRQSSGDEIAPVYSSKYEMKGAKIPISTHNVPGIVALAQKPLAINNIQGIAELRKVHRNLTHPLSPHHKAANNITSTLAIPLKPTAVTLGVLQLFNKKDHGSFSKADFTSAKRIGDAIGKKFQVAMHATDGLFEHLVESKLISIPELEKLEKKAKKEKVSVGSLLMKSDNIEIDDIGISYERYYLTPFMAYDKYVRIPEELVENVKDAYMRANRWVPVSGDAEKAFILIDDPTDIQRIMEIESLLGAKHYVFMVGLVEDIIEFIDRAPRVKAGVKSVAAAALMDLDSGGSDQLVARHKGGELRIGGATTVSLKKKEREDVSEDVIKLVNKIIETAKEMGSSDIHIQATSGDAPGVVRFRIDGACRPVMEIPSGKMKSVAARIKIISELDIAERRKPQDGKCVYKMESGLVELRIATVPTVSGENVVMRILSASEPLPLQKLNFSSRNLKELNKLAAHPHGILLVVGPTGSGKTTTLHAVLGSINTPEKVIWTAEDPVEITQQGLNQVQMHPKIGLNFAVAMRSFLRADPDVIMIGEMRDQETARIGVEASLTGHLVMSTLHTNSAAETITRLLELDIDPVNFSDALLGVLAQRLLRTLCEKCKKSYEANDDEFEMMKRHYGEEYFDELGIKREGLKLYIPAGCDICGGTGYKGRTGVHELLVSSPEIRELIYKGATATQIHSLGVKQGMRTIMQDGIMKILKGQSDISQLIKVAAV